MSISMDHIAIASQQPDKTKAFFKALQLSTSSEEVPSQKVTTTFFHLDSSEAAVEILEPTSPESPISKFLQKRSGIHHIALRVQQIEKTMADLKAQGYKLINEEPQTGSHQSRIAFIHPESTGGILVELVERTS